jgi:hypothetical protein
MAQHGYLGDGYGTHGEFDADRDEHREHRSEDRDRDRERFSRDQGRERSWNEESDRDQGFLFGENEGARAENRTMSHYRREHGYGGFQGDYSRSGREQGGFGGFGDYQSGRRSLSANPDEHYRSWRDRHIAELDRDYEDYCREREQRFHHDFDAWRNQRHGSPGPLRTGMTQTGLSADPTGMTQTAGEAGVAPQDTPDPMATATLGTNSSGGRRGR